MAAYKKDINLFKAAGGERAKSKKMATTKKLVYVAVLVVILVAGAIAALMYFGRSLNKQLSDLEQQANNYSNTAKSTRSLIEEYNSVKAQMDSAVLIEYQSMLQPAFSTDLSAAELKAVRDFLSLETTGFTIDNNFDDVVDDVLAELNMVQYRDESTSFSDDVYNAKFLYGALSFMKTMQPVFSELPLQTTDDDEDFYYWYCYYRGKFVMMLRSTSGSAATLAAQLQSPSELGCAPFCSLLPTATNMIDSDNAIYSTVTLTEQENTSYVIIAITCKTVPERFTDILEDVFSQQQGTIQYRYALSEYTFDRETSTFSVNLRMTQSSEFRLKDVCDAVAASPFFASRPDFAYETNDSSEQIERNLVFDVTNEAVNATYDLAVGYFSIYEEEAAPREE